MSRKLKNGQNFNSAVEQLAKGAFCSHARHLDIHNTCTKSPQQEKLACSLSSLTLFLSMSDAVLLVIPYSGKFLQVQIFAEMPKYL